MAGAFVLNFLRFLVLALQLLILARVLLSWVDPGGRGQLASFIVQTTEPILAPVRRVLPRTGHVRPLAADRHPGARRPPPSAELIATARQIPARAVRLAVRLTPGAGVDRIDGVVDGVLRARVAARPVDGAANDALLRLIADALGVPRSRVALRSGAAGRSKLLELEGVDARAAAVALAGGRCMIGACPGTLPAGSGGRLAQWLEHAVHIRGVTGSNPVSPTTPRALIRTHRSVADLRSSVTYISVRSLPASVRALRWARLSARGLGRVNPNCSSEARRWHRGSR